MTNPSNTTDNWFLACKAEDVPDDGGVCVQFGERQIALFHFSRRKEWFATQNMCPHRRQMAISRGMLGSQNNEPKVACPFHKKTFSLVDGRCMNSDEDYRIDTYPVRIVDGYVYIQINQNEFANHHHCSPINYEK